MLVSGPFRSALLHHKSKWDRCVFLCIAVVDNSLKEFPRRARQASSGTEMQVNVPLNVISMVWDGRKDDGRRKS